MGLMKIGEVAREISLSDRRIREYERAGLIRVRREPRTGDRLFDDRAIAQLRLIKTLIHDRGFTIEALRSLIQYAPCWELTDCPRRDSCPIISSP
ncbi:MAG: MerR family transcriptional regulator, partial [Planctomycetota bacterium]